MSVIFFISEIAQWKSSFSNQLVNLSMRTFRSDQGLLGFVYRAYGPTPVRFDAISKKRAFGRIY